MSDSSSPPDGGEGFQKKPSGIGKAFSKLDLEGHNLPPSPAPSSPRSGRKYALATELVYTEGTDQYNASSTPIYQVSWIGFKAWTRLPFQSHVRLEYVLPSDRRSWLTSVPS